MTRLFLRALAATIAAPWVLAFTWTGCAWIAQARRDRRRLADIAAAHANMQTAGWTA